MLRPSTGDVNREELMMRMAPAWIGLIVVLMAPCAVAQEPADIPLPAARTEGGRPLMEVLRDRQSSREYGGESLPLQTLSDLLWAAAGINRPDSGKRTAPSARNWQEIEVYAVTSAGAYLYDAGAHALKAVAPGDLRAVTGSQPFVAVAPLNLVLVADLEKMKGAAPEDQSLYAGADAAFISQNIYLFCASEGLATVVRGLVDREAVARALKLPEHKRVIFAQSVGFPGGGDSGRP